MWIYYIGLFSIILAAKLALIGHFGNSTPFWDQWSGQAKHLFIPALEDRLQPDALFRPLNEHRIFFTRIFTLGLLKLNGLWDPKVEMVAQAFLHSGCIVLLIGLCSRQLSGPKTRLAFAAFAVVIFVLPFGWENTLWGFQSQFYFVLLWGLLGISCCWKHPALSPRWWLGVFFLGLGLFSMAGGLLAPVVAGMLMALHCALDRGDRRRQFAGLVVLAALVGLGIWLARRSGGGNELHAKNLWQFTKTLLELSSWPIKIATFAPLFQAPLVLLLVWTLRTRRSASDPAWLLIALGLWGTAQAAAIAYARAEGFGASRYTDNLTVTLAVGFACLLYLCTKVTGRFRRPLLIFACVWVAVVGGGIVEAAVMRLPARIERKHRESLVQENHVRAFLASNDIGVLQNKARLDIPYPSIPELARLLNTPSLRAVLPTNLRDELQPAQSPSGSGDIFRLDGLPAEAPKPDYTTPWGSFDPITGHAPVGVSDLNFPAGGHTSWLTLSVAVTTHTPALSLVLIDEKGMEHPVALPAHTGPFWEPIVIHRPPGPFTLRMTDQSPTASLAFTLPKEIGFVTLVADFLQAKAAWIALLGLTLAGIGARFSFIKHKTP